MALMPQKLTLTGGDGCQPRPRQCNVRMVTRPSMPGIYDMQRDESPSLVQLFSKNGSVVVASALVVLACHDEDRFC